MRRLGSLRFLTYATLAVLVTLGGVRLVLSSGYAAGRVAGRLRELLGVPVRVGEADIGFNGGSSLRRLEVFEAGDDAPDAPWAVADGVQTDYAAVDLFGADMPKEVVFTGGAVELRFDEYGHMLTRLPKPGGTAATLPKLLVKDATLTLRQEGRALPLVVTGVNAEFVFADRVFRFTGSCADPHWGDWDVSGSYDADGRVFTLALKAEGVDVDAEKLGLVPFVPPSVWKHVRITAGRTPVDLALTVAPGKPVHYRVELRPTGTRLHVGSIDLDAEDASGTVVVEDRLVELRDVAGRTANGGIETEGDLDFRPAAARLAFTKIKVAGVELRELPESWFPENWKPRKQQLNGRLSGTAQLDVTIVPGRVVTNGGGKGDLARFTIQDKPGPPLKLHLRAADGRFHILPMPSLGPFGR